MNKDLFSQTTVTTTITQQQNYENAAVTRSQKSKSCALLNKQTRRYG